MLLFGDWGQQMDIEEQRKEIRSMRSELRKARTGGPSGVEKRLKALEEENDALKLHLAALIRYCTSKGVVDINEYRSFVEAIDESDGSADGKYDGDVA
jgi:hypothetical protein